MNTLAIFAAAFALTGGGLIPLLIWLLWRIAARRGVKGTRKTHLIPCERRRAETMTSGNGYLRIKMIIGGKRYITGARRLVWVFFNGPIPEGMEINHKNGVRDDNRPSTLEVVTKKQNMAHQRLVLGTCYASTAWRGENHPSITVSAEDVRAIRVDRESGSTFTALSKKFGISREHAWKLCARTRRKEVV